MERDLEPNAEALAANAALLEAREQVSATLCATGDGAAATLALTDAVDGWVRALWSAAGPVPARLVALGGFGRRELCLGSDVDLVIEVAEGADHDAHTTEAVQRFIAWARLTRVRVAHAVRTASQTTASFDEDFRTVVSYIDARALDGRDLPARDQALRFLQGDDHGEGFVSQLLDGYRTRLNRYGQTIYLLEPDVKSGKGALRDVHAIGWSAAVRGEFDPLVAASSALGWTLEEAAELEQARRWLLAVRGVLHTIHGRKHDRLHFPDQEAVAAVLVGADLPPAAAAEALMRRHYQVTRRVARACERALRRWSPAPAAIDCRIDDRFRVGPRQLFVEAGAELQPADVLEALRLAAEYDVLLDPASEGRLEAAVQSWTADIVDDRALCAAFCGLLTASDVTPRTSTRLLELGVLPRLVPEFEPVVCHVQHDVYHVYTTDVHLLRCLEFARDLLRPESAVATSWPAFREIAAQLDDPRVFLLSALFHDIGKNRGGGHSEKGAAMMLDVGPRLGLGAAQTELLSFLVREHLVLSHVTRRHDITDRGILRDLADRIRTVEALNQLTALTFCDASTVGRNAITDWNATLLLQLHQRLDTMIRHGVEAAWKGLELEVDEVRAWLRTLDGSASDADAFVRDLPPTYLVEASQTALARAFEAWRRGGTGETVVMSTPDLERGSTEVIVSAPDTPGVLAQITGAISSLGLNILDARIVTTSSGRLLDIFQVAQSGGASHALDDAAQQAVTDRARLDRLERRLLQVLNNERTAAELLEQRLAERKLAPRSTPQVETVVVEIPDVSDDYTVVQVKAPDRLGLLYEIARTLAQCHVDIRFSKIDSVGTQVIDTFYVETLDHQKLDPDQVARVLDALRSAVAEH